MAAVWFRFRAELRSRWKAMVVIALLAGFAGGVALAAAAGARRTDTAFSRLVAATKAMDILVNPDNSDGTALTSAKIRALPMVAEAGRIDGRVIIPADSRNSADAQSLGTVMVGENREVGYDFSRFNVLEGRMPDPTRADEVMIDPLLASQRGLHVGDDLKVLGLDAADLQRLQGPDDPAALQAAIRSGQLGTPISLRVVGVGISPDMVATDEGFSNPQPVLSPAFLTKYPQIPSPYWGEVVRLRRGAADIPAFRKAIARIAPGEAIAFQTATATAAKVDRAVKPQVIALAVFAAVMALAGLLVVGQALARQSFLDSVDHRSLRTLGFTRRQLFAAAMLRAGVVAVLGSMVAVLIAVAASPLTPIGPARRAEPDPGIRLDGPMLVLGALVILLSVLALAAIPAWRYARTRAGADRQETMRPSRLAGAAARAGAPLSLGAGVRLALEPGRGRTAVPVRTTVVSAALAIATVVAAVVFAASLDHLVTTPRLYGWNWDSSMVVSGNTQAEITSFHDQLVSLLERSKGVAGWSTVQVSELTVDGTPMPAVGAPAGRKVTPTVVSGRLPSRDDEIALGARSLRALGRSVGDTVVVAEQQGGARSMRVVGRVVLPGLATYPGQDKTSLGEGAVVTPKAMATLGPDFGNRNLLVRFRSAADGARVDKAASALATRLGQGDNFATSNVLRTSDILAYERVRTLPLVLAGILALLAVATVAHALVSAVRRRRRDLAMLKTLGFSRRQISGTVAWQATTVGVLALVVGLPLGVVAGRWGWRLLADNLGTVSEPIVPVLALVAAVPVVLLLFNAVAYLPGRAAARLRPATVLRSE